jgi:uncharacterized protein YhdP
MTTRTRRRLAVIAAAAALAAVLIVMAGLHLASRQLQSRIESALGPRASVGAIDAGWTGIEVLDLRIKGAPGWPAQDELRARRVRIVPDLRSLFGGPWRIAKVRVEGGYVSALRTRDGKMRLVPALLDARSAEPASTKHERPAAATPLLEIGQVELAAAGVDFFDASVRQPALQLRIADLDAEVGPLMLPALDKATGIKLDGVFKGPQRDGRIAIDGHYTPATRDAALHARFSGVDMVALQPYLLKVSEAGVRRGSLDLDLQATLVRNKLRAPGRLTLTNLELTSDGPLSTFAGVPRKAVLAAMTQQGRLEVNFTLEGRLDDPSFSLNENLATRIASGMAESLGVSLSGMVKGLGGVVKGLFGR